VLAVGAAGIELMEHHARLDRPVLWAGAENWRFKKTTQRVEDIVACGALGEIRFADFTYLSFQKPDNLRWRGSPTYAGGYMLDSGVHFIALLRKIMVEIGEVSASVSQRISYLPPADSVTAILSFANGADGQITLVSAAWLFRTAAEGNWLFIYAVSIKISARERQWNLHVPPDSILGSGQKLIV
jgi:predicted dehydrogenase